MTIKPSTRRMFVGLDESGTSGLLAKRLTQDADPLSNRIVSDERPRPDVIEEHLLRHQPSVVLYEQPQRFELLRGKVHQRAVAQQPLLDYLESELAKLVRRVRTLA